VSTAPDDDVPEALDPAGRAEGMRAAMADYVRSVHQAYASGAAGQPPAVRGRLLLYGEGLTVLAAGARNLHVVATTDRLAPPSGQEVALEDEVEGIRWTLRFFDPVVLPALGLVDESDGPAYVPVRRILGVSTAIYHLVVQPGAQLSGHQASHAGAGLAMDHLSDVRDFETIRSRARGAEALVDEMEGAAAAGLPRAQALLATEVARQVAPWDGRVADLAAQPDPDPTELRRTLLDVVQGGGSRE
jgi:hypothetical protein